MTRSSQRSAERKLLDAARAMLDETGIAGLRLRAVARRAGVNLGLFSYHFGSKEEFSRRLIQDIYDEFFNALSLESQTEGTPLERLRRALIVFGRFARDQRGLFSTLLGEVLRGDKNAAAYLKANMPRHVRVVANLIDQGQRKGLIKGIPVPIAVAFALGGMGAPNVAINLMERLKTPALPQTKADKFKKMFLSDAALEQRAELILSGLAAGPVEKRGK